MKLNCILIAFFFLTACKSKKSESQPGSPAGPQVVIVDVLVAETTAISNSIEVNGTVVAFESAELHPEMSGRLVYLNIPEGSFVKQGTVLAKINDAEITATLNRSKVQLELAEKTEERLRKLLSISGVNQADYDAALNQVNTIKADIAFTQAQIEKTTVRAPFSGTLGLRMVSPGAYITPASVLATLQQTDRLKIDFTVPEVYAHLIQKGRVVSVQTAQSAIPGKAVITATEPVIDASSRNLKVRSVYQGGALSPGSFVKVVLNTSHSSSGILVPTSAIIPDAKAKKMVVVQNGKGRFVDIETGLRTSATAEVSKGIHPGDSIVVTGVLFVRPNSPVRIRSVKQLNDFVQ